MNVIFLFEPDQEWCTGACAWLQQRSAALGALLV